MPEPPPLWAPPAFPLPWASELVPPDWDEPPLPLLPLPLLPSWVLPPLALVDGEALGVGEAEAVGELVAAVGALVDAEGATEVECDGVDLCVADSVGLEVF